jgi:hypothetical protein
MTLWSITDANKHETISSSKSTDVHFHKFYLVEIKLLKCFENQISIKFSEKEKVEKTDVSLQLSQCSYEV